MNVGNLQTYNKWREMGYQVQKGQQMIAIDPKSGLALFGEYQVQRITTRDERDWEYLESLAFCDPYDNMAYNPEDYH